MENNKRVFGWIESNIISKLSSIGIELTEVRAARAIVNGCNQISTTPEHLLLLAQSARYLKLLIEANKNDEDNSD